MIKKALFLPSRYGSLGEIALLCKIETYAWFLLTVCFTWIDQIPASNSTLGLYNFEKFIHTKPKSTLYGFLTI